MATSHIFHDFLVEEFEKRTQGLDIVETKRKHFESLLNKAHNALRGKKITEAKQCYFDIIEYLRNDPYHDELNLSADLEFCIKCCFCYSSVIDPSFCQENTVINTFTEELINTLLEEYTNRLFPKYLKVLLSYKRKNWILSLYWCNIVIMHKEEEANYKSVDFFNELLPSQSEITSNVEKYEENAFYGYGQKLTNKYSSMKTDQKCNPNDDESFLSECNQCMRNKIQQYILKEQPTFNQDTIGLGEILQKFLRFYQEIKKYKFTDMNDINLFNKILEIEDLVPNGKTKTKSDDKLCIGQTQTDKIKSGNKFVQTEGVKSKNAEVQVNLESQTLNTLLDIKSKLLTTQEKKDTINKLNKKINELYEKASKETDKRKSAEEEFQRKLAKQEFEINMLQNQLNKCDIERKQECEKNISLQKLFVEQTNDKFNMQKNIYKTFERKSVFMVNYLREINQYLTPNSVPTDVVIKQNIDIWEGRSRKIQEDLTELNIFYKNVRADMIKSNQFNMTWPDMPDFPGDEDNIVFVSFKPAIKNIIDIEAKLINSSKTNIQRQPHLQMLPTLQYNVPRPQYPLQNSSFYVGQRFIYQNSPSIIVHPNNPPQQYYIPSRERVTTEMHMQHQQTHVEQKPNLNKNLKTTASPEIVHRTSERGTAGYAENPINIGNGGATSSKIISEKDSKSIEEKEEVLFEYVYSSCSGATEAEVTIAMLQVMDDNGGTLSKFSKEEIVEEVKTVLRMKRQSAWVVPKSPFVDWKNDHSEHNCSICFEEFSLSETYTLQCQHVYHKECIKKWLKTSSVCPICRLHSVIDDEFPPLH